MWNMKSLESNWTMRRTTGQEVRIDTKWAWLELKQKQEAPNLMEIEFFLKSTLHVECANCSQPVHAGTGVGKHRRSG